MHSPPTLLCFYSELFVLLGELKVPCGLVRTSLIQILQRKDTYLQIYQEIDFFYILYELKLYQLLIHHADN